ncbi:PAS domain S-box protein [Fictibacillus iocasae]|uniref:histidine kinase n=1 Tax=Fictibacillus iocasae TaxID=2715437 RepID=A0ABW2NUR0_9BACL
MHVTHYNSYLVLLSLCISVFASYVALYFVEKSTAQKFGYRILYAGSAFGLGIWAMHFLAMTSMEIEQQYDPIMTIVSLLIAIAASSLSFFLLFYFKRKMIGLIFSSLLLSTGITSMHYIGIYAMEYKGLLVFNLFYIVLSKIITFFICFGALNIFYFVKDGSKLLFINKWTSALFMGLSIPSMHFVAMNGLSFLPDESLSLSPGSIEESMLPVVVVFITATIIVASLLLAGYENKVAKEAAKWGEERYQSLFRHNPDAVFTLDLDGRFMSINPAGEALTGYKAEELIGQSFAPLISVEDIERTYYHFKKSLEGHSQEYTIWAINKQNERRLVSVKNVPMIWREKIVGAYSICTDITQLHQTQKDLKKEQTLYKTILSTMSDGLVVIDQKGKMILANENAANMMNMSYEDFLKTSPLNPSWQLIREDGSDYLPEEKPVFQSLMTGETFNRRVIGVKQTLQGDLKSVLWASANVSPMMMDGVLKGVIITFRDITKQKEQEDELKVSNEIMSTLIENLQFGVLEEDEHRNILLANKECFKIFGSTADPKTLYGQNISNLAQHLRRLFPDHLEVKRNTDALIENQKVVTDEITINTGRLIRRTYIPIFSNEVYKGHFWKVEDITEERKLEESLYLAKEEAEKANRTKSEFLSKMSHELRTPLNAILGFAQILEFDLEEPLTLQQNQRVQEILQAGRHLLHLINEVLDLSRIEAGHTAFEFQHVVFQDLLNQSLALVQKQAAEMDVRISIKELPETPAILNVDATRFQQIVLNLLTNAIKYNKEEGRVQLSAVLKEDYLTLHVEDTGTGIPESELPFIFDPFYRGSFVKRSIEGTGVGLSIAKMMTEKMGGEMLVQSEEGTGSLFTIRFPVANQIMDALLPEERKESYHFSSKKILYIEDNASNTAVMKQFLRSVDGIELTTARSPGEGLMLAKSVVPDLILLDLHMPGMSGMEVFDLLRRTGTTQLIPIIAVSAAAMESDIQQAMAAGFTDYVTKPIDVNRLLNILSKHLNEEVNEVIS